MADAIEGGEEIVDGLKTDVALAELPSGQDVSLHLIPPAEK